ncbi:MULTISPECIES: hypothetical protein [unclassified Meridianimarinicoccus]|uniref:hypothetical protein n=1 Tax=unclassified Meridianimarinicoccus TaxID=2923344 RepID=UPI001867D4C4|nr:hypothetical protein [Fluviibacterium sp. MJW13]
MSDPTIDAVNKSLPKGERMAPGLQSVLAMRAGAIGMAMTPAPLVPFGQPAGLANRLRAEQGFQWHWQGHRGKADASGLAADGAP